MTRPTIPAAFAAQLQALQRHLAEAEQWSREQLARHQCRLLTELVAHAFEAIPFYRARLAALRYRRGQEITPEFWARLPVLSRREVQDQGEGITCAAVPAGHGRILPDATSGSTGTPLRIRKTERAQMIWYAVTLREHLWHRRDFRLKLATIRRDKENRAAPPKGRSSRDWGVPISALYKTGPACLLDNRCTPREQAEWLLREAPDYLLTYPSIVQELARHFRDREPRLRQLKSILTLGEVVTPRLRMECREVFGAEIVDMYSATETGYLGLQCPLHPHFHAQSETVLVEVLDEAGAPCAPGAVGTVVVTPLHNYAMPLLRYAPGDLAEVGGACSCGRRLPVLTQILGRARDTVMLPSGTRRYAWIGLKRLGDIREVVQFQVVQRSLYELEAKLVTRGALTPEIEETIRQTLKASLGEHFSVALTYHDAIPRAASGKYFDFVSEVPG